MPHKDYTGLDSNLINEETLMPSTIETIDRALYSWVEDLNLYASTNKGWKKTNVMWVSAERAFQLKHNKELRDINGVLKLPLITVERTDITKSPEKKGSMWANVVPPEDGQGGAVIISRTIQQEKTADFRNAQSARKNSGTGNGQVNFKTGKANKPVIVVAYSPLPVYVEATYAITIRTEYQQQMNDLIVPFLTKVGPFPGGNANYFTVERDGHLFEAFIQESFSQENNVASMEEDERTYITKVEIKVLGHLLGEGPNADQPRITYRESVVSVKVVEERSMLDEKPTHIDHRGFYRSSPPSDAYSSVYRATTRAEAHAEQRAEFRASRQARAIAANPRTAERVAAASTPIATAAAASATTAVAAAPSAADDGGTKHERSDGIIRSKC